MQRRAGGRDGDQQRKGGGVHAANRQLLAIPKVWGLVGYTLLACDSMQFDPSPYADSMNLGLVDAAHDLVHVGNDSLKMARMMSENGIVFGHDYKGKGGLRPLATYLERLSKKCPLYRIVGTTLAWGPVRDFESGTRGSVMKDITATVCLQNLQR